VQKFVPIPQARSEALQTMEAAKLHRIVVKSHSRFNSPVQGCGGHHVFIANIHPRTKSVTETFFVIFTSSSDEEGIPETWKQKYHR